MTSTNSVTDIIRARYSCRTYRQEPLHADLQAQLSDYLSPHRAGPFGTNPRFRLAAANEQDPQALKKLGTYGFVKGAPAFIISAARPSPGYMEDLGYLLERIVLHATNLGLGTCWLGGTFTYSSFASRIDALEDEQVPAVISVGYPARQPRIVDGIIRRAVGAHNRKPWQDLFFDGDFSRPLTQEAAAAYATPLEMVRLGPSASNRQPWRVVQTGAEWHFYLSRSGVSRAMNRSTWVPVSDLKKADLGIAMCHFQMAAEAMGLRGRWEVRTPQLDDVQGMDYTATWVAS